MQCSQFAAYAYYRQAIVCINMCTGITSLFATRFLRMTQNLEFELGKGNAIISILLEQVPENIRSKAVISETVDFCKLSGKANINKHDEFY